MRSSSYRNLFSAFQLKYRLKTRLSLLLIPATALINVMRLINAALRFSPNDNSLKRSITSYSVSHSSNARNLAFSSSSLSTGKIGTSSSTKEDRVLLKGVCTVYTVYTVSYACCDCSVNDSMCLPLTFYLGFPMRKPWIFYRWISFIFATWSSIWSVLGDSMTTFGLTSCVSDIIFAGDSSMPWIFFICSWWSIMCKD